MNYVCFKIKFKLGHADMIDLLIKKGLNVNAVDNDGETPLHKASQILG